MTIDDVASRVSAALGTAGVPFMLAGGSSSNHHGIPRSRKDADFVVQLSAPLNEAFARTLGPESEAEPQMPFETNTGTQRQESRVAGTLFKVEVFRLSEDAHDPERFRRRQAVMVDGRQVFFPTAEDVTIGRLRWARAKDREDVRAVIGVRGEKRANLAAWIANSTPLGFGVSRRSGSRAALLPCTRAAHLHGLTNGQERNFT